MTCVNVELFVGLAITIIGIRAIMRRRFSLSDAAPKITLTGERARLFGMICIISASLTLISWLYLVLNNQFQTTESTKLTVLCVMTVLTAAIGFLIMWFIEFLRGSSDDASTYSRAIARKRKPHITLNFPNSSDLANEEILNSGAVIRLGDDGELIYGEESCESASKDQSTDYLP